jgi:hypothetical protein
MRQPDGFKISCALGYGTLRPHPRQLLCAISCETREVSRVDVKEGASIDRFVEQAIRWNAFGFESGNEPVTRGARESLRIIFENELIDCLSCQPLISLEERDAWNTRQPFR